MADMLYRPPNDAARDAASERLDSWKEIASYLKRDVTTVQRWERKEGLPVHRKVHDKLGSVYAFRSELDAWWSSGRSRIEKAEPGLGSTLRPDRRPLRLAVRRLLRGTAAVSLAFAAGGLLVWSLQRNRSVEVAHLQVATGTETSVADRLSTPSLALSPDGDRLAYVARRNTTSVLRIRRLSDRATATLAGTEGATSPFFSPDGQWLGFVSSDNKLKKIPVTGGAALVICNVPQSVFRGASWGDDDWIVFAQHSGSGLSRVRAGGGDPEGLTTPSRDRLEKTHRFPEVLPGANAVLFTSYTADITSFDEAQLELLSLDTGERQVLVRGAAQGRYASSGHVVFGRGGSLFAVPFDLRRREVTGTPVPVLDSVTMGTSGSTELALSRTGVLAYISGGQSPDRNSLIASDRRGRLTSMMEERRDFADPRFSPDGTRILVHVDGPNEHLWMYHTIRKTFARLTFAWDYVSSIWTPDGRQITFFSGVPGMLIGSLPADAGGPGSPLVERPPAGLVTSWSPDGSVLLLHRVAGPPLGWDLWTWEADAGLRPLLQEPLQQHQGVFSPDGRYIAYTSNETGRNEVYARPFRAEGAKVQISSEGGEAPRWAAGEIFFRSGDRVMAARVRTAPGLAADVPLVLFEAARPGAFSTRGWNGSWDVSRDGQRFVFVEALSNGAPAQQINVVINWFDELKRIIARASTS